MKKVITLLLMMVLVITGCGKENKKILSCEMNDVKFDEGKMNVVLEIELDKKDIVLSTIQTEKRTYDKKSDATSFYNLHKNTVTKESDKVLIYKGKTEYSDKVKAESLKSALEGQGYKCEYKMKED